MKKAPKVFISYAHDTERFSDQVLEFANKLRENYIDANIDQYEESPAQGWPRWMEDEIDNSDYVVVICTEAYYDKVKQYKSGVGKGVNWEVNIIYQHLYDDCCDNQKFIPVVFDNHSTDNILKPLKSSTIYRVDRSKDFNKLCNRLKGIKNVRKPGLGETSVDKQQEATLESRERKSMFVTTLIDVDKWNRAMWGGITYMFERESQEPPIMAFTFDNHSNGVRIFEEWKSMASDYFDELAISVVEGQDSEGVDGYYVIISTDMDYCVEKMEASGLEVEETLITTISRSNFMQTTIFSNNLNVFKKQFEKLGEYRIAPASFRNGRIADDGNNIEIDLDNTIRMRKIKLLKMNELNEDDFEYALIAATRKNIT